MLPYLTKERLDMELRLINHEASFAFAEVDSVAAGLRVWLAVAGVGAGLCLVGFEVKSDEGTVLYAGDYVTNEC